MLNIVDRMRANRAVLVRALYRSANIRVGVHVQVCICVCVGGRCVLLWACVLGFIAQNCLVLHWVALLRCRWCVRAQAEPIKKHGKKKNINLNHIKEKIKTKNTNV